MIDFTGMKARPVGMISGAMGAGVESAAAVIARGQAEVDAFIAGRASALASARAAAPRPVRERTSRAAAPSTTPEQRRVDALGYPASWTENGQEAIAAARAAAPGGAGVDYPASWKA
ncbi:MAG: hypothetical protein PIR02_08810 [Microbacterium enclense]